jgi:RecA/RadA recombinase
MAKIGKPTKALQENVLAMLLHNEKQGKLVAGMVDPELFEGDYGIIAEKAVDYWKRYGRAPGAQTGDLVADIIDAGDAKARLYEEILRSTVELADTVNETYVLDQLRAFVRVQQIKRAIMQSAERINAQAELATDEVEAIWNDLLRSKEQIAFNRGLSLAEFGRVLDYLEGQQLEFPMGITQFDEAHIGPARGTVLLLLGPSGKGKSWFCVHLGKMALLAGKRVLHITLEMSEEQVAQRYYQSLFSASKRDRESERPKIRFPKGEVSLGITYDTVDSEFILRGFYARDELELRLNALGSRAVDNVIVKRFANLTMDGLEAYLDGLQNHENWTPDLLILDYWQLVDPKVGADDYRLGMGRAFKKFRSIMVERNIAGVTPNQVTRKGIESTSNKMTDASEDISVAFTADVVLNYSSTDKEQRRGLGRLYVSKGRDERDKFGVFLTQHYETGQYALESIPMSAEVYNLISRLSDGREDDDEGGSEESNERRFA